MRRIGVMSLFLCLLSWVGCVGVILDAERFDIEKPSVHGDAGVLGDGVQGREPVGQPEHAKSEPLRPDASGKETLRQEPSFQEPVTPDRIEPPELSRPDFTWPDRALTCADLSWVPAYVQVSIVTSDTTCMTEFVRLLVKQPAFHLDAFYVLVAEHKTTEPLFFEVYNGLRKKTFVFDGPVIEQLFRGFPKAVAACQGHNRCGEWKAHLLSAFLRGDFYRCPAFSGLSKAQLQQSIPYGNYDCTARMIPFLAPVFDGGMLSVVGTLAKTHPMPWARRNGLRVLGRLMERPSSEPVRDLLRVTKASDVQQIAMDRLMNETEFDVLSDAIWLIDSFYFPYFPAKPAFLRVAHMKNLHESGRFRAIAAYSRLLKAQTSALSSGDVQDLQKALKSDNVWVRAQAAFIIETISSKLLTAGTKQQLLDALQAAWAIEKELLPRAYMARALDKYTGTSHLAKVKADYEKQHIPTTAQSTNQSLTVRGAGSQSKLQGYISLMQSLRAAFFSFMGTGFQTPVTGDTNPKMTLVVLPSKAHYTDYLNAFVGGARGGGIYIEKTATLYTYERKPGESSYTVEDLIKHEFMHYMQGRYVYPGQWQDATYHNQPRGWADEGFAEFFAGIQLGANGSYTFPVREVSMRQICGTPYRKASDLLAQRAGYDKDGTFDYPFAWAWTYFLFTRHKAAARKIWQSFRDKSYQLSAFQSISGLSVSSLHTSWHQAIKGWCKDLKLPVSSEPHAHTGHWHRRRTVQPLFR